MVRYTDAELDAGIHALGDRAALERLIRAAQRGLKVVVLGGSISEGFAGRTSSKPRSSRDGFVGRLLAHVSARFPNATGAHAITNRARGGNDARHLRPCARSSAPLDADVVFMEYAVNGGTPDDFEFLLSVWRTYPGGGPMIVVLNSFFWCRDERGEHALTAALHGCGRRRGEPAQCKRNALAAHCRVRNNGERLRNVTRCTEAAIEASMAPCGAAVLSIFDVLAPQVISAKVISSTSEISTDGYHPPKMGNGHMVYAWARLLARWFDAAVASIAAPPDTALVDGQNASQRAGLTEMLLACSTRPHVGFDHPRGVPWARLAQARSYQVPQGGARGTSARRTTCYSVDAKHLPKVPVLGESTWHEVMSEGAKLRPGLVSVKRGDVLRLELFGGVATDGGAALPVQSASISLLHSYENAGTVRIRCAGSCTCAETVHSTRWSALSSGDKNVEVPIAHNGSVGESGGAGGVSAEARCVLEVLNESDEKVKLNGLAVDVRRRQR